MKKSKNAATLVSGILIGAMLSGPAAHAAEQYLKAYHSTQSFYLNGEKVAVEAYNIEGHNYLQLAELGKLLGVSVAYQDSDNSVQIGTASQAVKAQDSTVNLPADGSRYMPKIGDVSGTLRAQEHGHQPLIYENHGIDSRYTGPLNVAPTMSARYGTGGNNVPLVEQEPVFCITGNAIDRQPQNGGNGIGYQTDLAYTLTATDHHAVFSRQRVDVFKDGKHK